MALRIPCANRGPTLDAPADPLPATAGGLEAELACPSCARSTPPEVASVPFGPDEARLLGEDLAHRATPRSRVEGARERPDEEQLDAGRRDEPDDLPSVARGTGGAVEPSREPPEAKDGDGAQSEGEVAEETGEPAVAAGDESADQVSGSVGASGSALKSPAAGEARGEASRLSPH
jgi:hypothetical protein